ncbi:gliding motility-associated C-terminal domain-containing protein, partial [Olleya sp. Ti.3.14]|uniref:gliding motility-associated C-terminal domain-containing protein n=1 Tax=Olleya sp. Ti.3.14 TaxID=3121297 RepID=UPI00311E500C
TNTNGVLEPTETWIFTAPNYTVTQADIDAGVITNTVTVTGNEILNNTEVSANDTYVIDENNTDVMFCPPTGSINIVKTGVFNNDNDNECTEIDETISYTFTVTNTGNVSLGNIVITDSLLDNAIPTVTISLISGDLNNNNILEPTETWIYTATYLVTQIDIDATEVINIATVNSVIIVNGEIVTDTDQITTELIEDITPPDSSTCEILDETIECNGDNNLELATNWDNANILALENCATDACDDTIEVTSDFDYNNLISTCGNSGTILVTYTLTDATGNFSMYTATITIEDTTGPDLTACTVIDETIECGGTDNQTIADAWNAENMTALQSCGTDTCDVDPTNTVTSDYDFANLVSTCGASGTITVTYTVADDCGNTSQLTATLTLEDTTGPDLTACTVINETIECGGTDNQTIADAWNAENMTALQSCGTDTCDVVPTNTVTSDYDFANLVSTCGASGTITVTYTVADDCGNTSQLTATLTLEDTTGPDLTACTVIDETIECGGTDNQTIADAWNAENMTALQSCGTDTCDVDPTNTVTSDYDFTNLVSTCGASGTITVTYTVADDCGNTSQLTATLTLEDTTGPDLTACTVINETIECGGTDNQTIADAWNAENMTALQSCGTDTCDIDPTNTVTSDYDFANLVSTCGASGTITVTYTVADDCGNTSQLTATLTLEDTTGPDLTACTVIDETIECGGTDNQTIADAWNTENMTALQSCGTDTCDVDPTNTVTSDYDFTNLVSTCGASGMITVTYTVADDCGNTSQLTATLTLEDTTGPALLSTLDLPSSVICSNVPEVPQLDFEDTCSLNPVTVEFNETTTFTGEEEIYDIIWTWTATDDCGNENVITHTINVITENFTTPLEGEKCIEDGLIDLYDYLPEVSDNTIEWVAVTEGVTIIDGIFDPLEVELGDYVFTYTTLNNGCLNTFELTITIHDDCTVLPCGEDDLKISKAVTPNGDAYNEFFTVGGVEECGFIIDIKIFNRFGDIVYESRDYQNNWNGQSPSGSVGSAGRLPNGTYYYVIDIKDSGIKPLAGPLYLGTK